MAGPDQHDCVTPSRYRISIGDFGEYPREKAARPPRHGVDEKCRQTFALLALLKRECACPVRYLSRHIVAPMIDLAARRSSVRRMVMLAPIKAAIAKTPQASRILPTARGSTG